MAAAPVNVVMRRLARAVDGLDEPAVEKIARNQREDPFQVLIATMLSAQTKDAVTAAASARHVQRFVSIHDPIANLFHFPRNQLTAADYRAARAQAFEDWAEIAGARLAA